MWQNDSLKRQKMVFFRDLKYATVQWATLEHLAPKLLLLLTTFLVRLGKKTHLADNNGNFFNLVRILHEIYTCFDSSFAFPI